MDLLQHYISEAGLNSLPSLYQCQPMAYNMGQTMLLESLLIHLFLVFFIHALLQVYLYLFLLLQGCLPFFIEVR